VKIANDGKGGSAQRRWATSVTGSPGWAFVGEAENEVIVHAGTGGGKYPQFGPTEKHVWACSGDAANATAAKTISRIRFICSLIQADRRCIPKEGMNVSFVIDRSSHAC
jgi:hypothetical protein